MDNMEGQVGVEVPVHDGLPDVDQEDFDLQRRPQEARAERSLGEAPQPVHDGRPEEKPCIAEVSVPGPHADGTLARRVLDFGKASILQVPG